MVESVKDRTSTDPQGSLESTILAQVRVISSLTYIFKRSNAKMVDLSRPCGWLGPEDHLALGKRMQISHFMMTKYPIENWLVQTNIFVFLRDSGTRNSSKCQADFFTRTQILQQKSEPIDVNGLVARVTALVAWWVFCTGVMFFSMFLKSQPKKMKPVQNALQARAQFGLCDLEFST